MVNSGLGYGGAETQLIAVAQELHKRGHEVAVYLLTETAPRAGVLTRLGIKVITNHKASRLDFKAIWRLRQFIQSWRPQLVHGVLFDANIYVRLAAFGLGIPVLNSERSHGYELSLAQRAIHMSTRWLVDAVVANSYAGCAFAQDMYGFGPSKCFTVWTGVDLKKVDARRSISNVDYRQEFFGSPDLKLAVLVGTIKAAKDHLLAIAVAEQFLDATGGDWGVAFIGAASDGRLAYASQSEHESNELAIRVANRLKDSRHAKRIRLVGHRADALEIIASADILYCTSRNEGFPNVVLEAMAVGTPVVSTNYSDISMILENPNWVVKSRDPVEFAKRMIDVLKNRAKISIQVRQWVEQNATIELSSDALEVIYMKHVEARQLRASN